MNRRERRQTEKNLGITKYKQSMTIQQRLKSLKENIEHGKLRSSEMKNKVDKQKQNIDENVVSNEIASIATTLTITENLSWYEAMEKAKEIYKEKTA